MNLGQHWDVHRKIQNYPTLSIYISKSRKDSMTEAQSVLLKEES